MPAAFKDVTDGPLLAEFKASNQAVIDALNAYQAFLKTDLLPRSQGDFRIGADTYRKKLLYDEMVDIPLDRLLEIGRQDLRRNQEEFKRVAALVDKSRTAEQILNETLLDHPAGGQAAAEFSRRAGRTARLHRDETDRDDSVEGAADCGGNAALHAGADHRLDGHAGTVREGRKGGILQRHASREDVGR